MENKKLTQKDMLKLVLEDLGNWIDRGGNESDDSMVYAYENGYFLHAANLWLGTGASSDSLNGKIEGLKINRSAELKEIRKICREAFIYICPDCNHHAFLSENRGVSTRCFSCLKSAYRGPDNVRIYDNGGKTFDRYTVVYMDRPESKENTFDARGMSEHPFSPQGFGCSTTAMPGRHLGKRIKFSELPKDCQKLVAQDLSENES